MSNADKFGTIVPLQDPRGRFREGKLATGISLLPGQCIKRDSSGTFVAGMGGEIHVLREYDLTGSTVSDAIPAGGRFLSYHPLPGDDFLALGLSGETLATGARATFNAAGKLIASATGPLTVEEGVGTLAADELVLVRLGGLTSATV